jgi:hypothetical protein
MTQHEQTNKIIEQLYSDRNLNDAINKYFPTNLNKRDEFKSHLFFEVLKINMEKIIELHKKDKLVFFVIAIIKRQVKSKTSSWFRYLRDQRKMNEYNTEFVCYAEVHNDYEIYTNKEHNEIETNSMANKIFKILDTIIQENPQLAQNIRMFISRHFYGRSIRGVAKDFNLKDTTCFTRLKSIESIIAIKLGIPEIKKYKPTVIKRNK